MDEFFLAANLRNVQEWGDVMEQSIHNGKIKILSRGEVFRLNKDGNWVTAKLTKINKHSDYLVYTFCEDGKQKRQYVHRAVAECFIPNPTNKTQVNHIDGNKANNKVENLEWVTPYENIQHAKRHGLYEAYKCNVCGRRVRCPNIVCKDCRKQERKEWKKQINIVLKENGKTMHDMAKDIGNSYDYMRQVISGTENGEKTVKKINNYLTSLQRR